MRNLWPDDLGKGELTSPSAIINEQASYLGKMTKNVVLAETDLLHNAQEYFRVAFYLVAPSLNNYKYRLFVAEHDLSFYPLTIDIGTEFGEELQSQGLAVEDDHYEQGEQYSFIRCNSEKEFLHVLEALLNSNRTKVLIQSLIAQSKAFRPDQVEDDIPF